MRLVHGHSASVGRLTSSTKACRILAAGSLKTNSYAAFLCSALAFAHRARRAAAILLRAEADIVRLTFAEAVVFVAPVNEFDFSRALSHLAFCAFAIFRREAADIIRFGWLELRDGSVPFNDSMTEIAWSNFSTCNCASRRSA